MMYAVVSLEIMTVYHMHEKAGTAPSSSLVMHPNKKFKNRYQEWTLQATSKKQKNTLKAIHIMGKAKHSTGLS